MGKTGVFGKSAGAVIAAAVVVCALCAGLTGCATQNSGNVTSDQDENSAVEKATMTTRTVTFPAIFFQDTAPLPQHQVLSASRKPVDKRAAKQNLHRHL